DLLKSNSSRLLLASGDALDFQTLLVDEDRAWLMVGAKNHVFLLHLDHPSREPEKIFWPAPREQVEHCQLAGKKHQLGSSQTCPLEQTECANFIRLLQPFNRSHVFACGTGSYQPISRFQPPPELTSPLWLWQGPSLRLVTHSLESGRGRCPYSPHEPFTGLLINGELYSGTSSDFMGSSAAFFRTWVHGAEQSYIRTEQNQDHWLHEPAFVSAYAIPDTYNPHDDKVYIFFRETAVEAGQRGGGVTPRVEGSGLRAGGVSRCLAERRGRQARPHQPLEHVPQGPPGEAPSVPMRALHGAAGTLTAPHPLHSGVFSGSAVCVYSMAAVRAAFSGPFAHKEGFDYRWVEYKGRVPYPRPGTGRQPFLVRVNVPYRLRRLLVHRLEVESRHHDVLFLGTDEGKVLKVGLAGGVSRGTEVISLEEISVTKVPSPILDMKLSPKRVSPPSHFSIKQPRDGVKTCTDCCLARDPYCTWDSRTCAPHLLTEKSPAALQPSLVPPASPCHGRVPWRGKLVFGVEKNSTFLECLTRSPQTTVRWLVQRSEEMGPSEVRNNGRFLVLEQGLLIRQLTREDTGTYECRAVERSFSRPL
ncbi:Semaphorin-3D, partial [Mesitornis unicolor]